MPIHVKIKGVWQGMAPVNDKYVKQAIAENKDLVITDMKSKQKMILRGEQLGKPRTKSGTYKDKFGGPDYTLYYFAWDTRQPETNLPLL